MLRKTKQQIAHTSMIPSLGNRDLRSLQEIINTEKAFIKSNAASGQSWHANAEALKAWGDGEGDDLSDVLSKMSLLLDNYSTAHTRLNTHLSTLRLHFKSIRTREEELANLKARKRSLASKIESVEKKLAKMGPENKELMKTTSTLKEYRSEMEGLNIELATEEAAIGDFKRRTTKEALGLKCGGLLEFAEKVTIIAEIGKMIIDEIPLDQTRPGMPRADYHSHGRTEQLLSEATRAISDVGFVPSGAAPAHSRPDLSHLDSSLPLNDEYEQRDALNRFVGRGDGGNEDGTAGNYDDQYAPNNTYDTHEDYNNHPTSTDNATSTTTPIYASHQTTQPWLKESASNRSLQQAPLQTDGLHDQSDWQRNSGGDAHQQSESFASPPPVGDDANWGRNSASDHHARASPTRGDELHQRAGSPDTAPSLPPLRASSPLPSSATPTATTAAAQTPSSPSAPPPAAAASTAVDDESYFTSIGSTRAAQAAARRPHSPTPSASFGAGAGAGAGSSSFGAAAAALPTTPSGTAYEPSDSGRKMTAAAFRKGFNRAPSGQHLGPAGRSGGDDVPSRENTASPSVPPLAIRKRSSAIVDAEPEPDAEAAPPYPASATTSTVVPPTSHAYDNHSSQPGDHSVSSAYDTNYSSYAPPPAIGQVYNGSRPGSSSGHYSNGGGGGGHPQQQQYPQYPQQQYSQQGQIQTPPVPGGYSLPGYASYAAGPPSGH